MSLALPLPPASPRHVLDQIGDRDGANPRQRVVSPMIRSAIARQKRFTTRRGVGPEEPYV
jgi:hypothetical protein